MHIARHHLSGKDPPSTQTYTSAFGLRVATLHKKHASCLASFLLGDKARRTLYLTCPSSMELKATMVDAWPDAGLEQLMLFATRRLAKQGLLE